MLAAAGLTLSGPRASRYGAPAILRGQVVPAAAGVAIMIRRGEAVLARAVTGVAGRFRLRTRLRSPGPYHALGSGLGSTPIAISLRPEIRVLVRGSRRGYAASATRSGKATAAMATTPRGGAGGAEASWPPALGVGGRRRVEGAATSAAVPSAGVRRRHPPRGGQETPAPVRDPSRPRPANRARLDGATGNTPVGRWRVYRKVPGWDWVLWYPMYFLRGFAVHGYPSVPPYPASHGCVRVPMWLAPSLYSTYGYGSTVYVY